MSEALHEISGNSRIDKTHKDLTDSRMNRDTDDVEKLLNYLIPLDPFEDIPQPRSISSGITADLTVNCDRAEEVGNNIMIKMEGKSVSNYTFK